MRNIFKSTLVLLLVLSFCAVAGAENTSIPFEGEVKANNINVRIDSTPGSQSVCTLNRTDPVYVVGQSYDWYKIRLPKNAPAYVKKTLVAPIDNKTAKVLKDNVNIRLEPNESCAILGKVQEGEILAISGDSGEWFQVEPPEKAYGWINKKFVLTFRTGIVPQVKKEEPKEISDTTPVELSSEGIIVAIGMVEPYGKVVNRIATHKLIVSKGSDQEKLYMLKGNRNSLNALNYHKVKVTGRLLPDAKLKTPVIEISKLELLN